MQSARDTVRAWEETVIIPTYPVPRPDKNPMFLDKRVYQGSSGKVYPNPFTDRVSNEKIDRSYKAVFLENEFVRLMILPEIGGRIHVGQDKTNNYDFFYRQTVIKPALVGLLGPWISGGVEFNWPQHHRPSTFMAVEHFIELEKGICTVWLSEHEPINRMKGMVGIRLRSGKSLIEATVRLYNRTPFVQTFLWWANVGVHVHDQYQAFFPPDVVFVADHAKRAMSWFPIARNFYYGVDYTRGVDLSWHKNIPVPTSYMVTQSNYDFFGGYDHAKQAGFVHYANHHIAPGKKLWTWGNAEFGYAWDRELTDCDGPYVELMAGVFTDNQPDFSWLQPCETKTFSQFWYPIQKIGPVKNANRLLAVNLEPADDRNWKIGVCATESIEKAAVVLASGQRIVFKHQASLHPGQPFIEHVEIEKKVEDLPLLVTIFDQRGTELIRYEARERDAASKLPEPATEPPLPENIASADELYVTGLHLEQYRHATRRPEPYWQEALRRDTENARSNNALGLLALRRGQFSQAVGHFETAIRRLTKRNPNPYDGEPFYNLGLARRFEGKTDLAYAAFYKAIWNYAWQGAAYYELAAIDSTRRDWETALDHLDRSLKVGTDNLRARNLKTAALRHLQRYEEALETAFETRKLDALDFWSRNELLLLGGSDGTLAFNDGHCLDLAFDYAHAGLWAEAQDVVSRFLACTPVQAFDPMLHYARAYFARQDCDPNASGSPDYCFPSRLEEMVVLETTLARQPGDARAHYYLGNLLYDKFRRDEAIQHWEAAARLDPGFSISWRNLGIAYYNTRRNPEQALAAYQRAFEANPADARILYEFDQLRKRTGAAPEDRLRQLEQHAELVSQRDDLSIELVTLYNQIQQSEKALSILLSRRFHPWEGGEGMVSGQYVAAHLLLGREALDRGDAAIALDHFNAARKYPQNLGEGKHLLTPETDIDYFSGLALARLGRQTESEVNWRRAADAVADVSPCAYYRALALRELGRGQEAASALQALLAGGQVQTLLEGKIDYFATSLPNFLVFEDDIRKRNETAGLFVCALAQIGLGRISEASKDLKRVLELDRNHVWAHFELEGVNARLGLKI